MAPLHGYARETLLGLGIGIPLVVIGTRTRITLPFNGLLGSLSYGVFLSHFLMIWGLDFLGMPEQGCSRHILTVTAGSTAMAFIGVRYLETRVDRVRKFEK
jgi:peptidoglycan/LPS O-acetylase OafA/YrhL